MQLITGDLEKMKLLIQTSLPGRTTELIKLHILRAEGKEWNSSNGAELPERTPRQRIYKFLSQTVHAYETDQELANQMGKYWTNFAYTGSPNSGPYNDLVEWKAIQTQILEIYIIFIISVAKKIKSYFLFFFRILA